MDARRSADQITRSQAVFSPKDVGRMPPSIENAARARVCALYGDFWGRSDGGYQTFLADDITSIRQLELLQGHEC